MAWITPKTDWSPSDFINTSDINRITNNLRYLHQTAQRLYSFTIGSLPSDQVVSDFPFQSKLNAIEQRLEEINLGTYSFDIGETKTYVANGHPFDYNELNRIESSTLLLYNTVVAEINGLPRLPFVLGRKQFGMRI